MQGFRAGEALSSRSGRFAGAPGIGAERRRSEVSRTFAPAQRGGAQGGCPQLRRGSEAPRKDLARRGRARASFSFAEDRGRIDSFAAHAPTRRRSTPQMIRVRRSAVIDAPIDRVWAVLR